LEQFRRLVDAAQQRDLDDREHDWPLSSTSATAVPVRPRPCGNA
jgi:hypothetical protein